MVANPANNWAGTNPIIEVNCEQKGMQPLSGTFWLSHGDESTIAIPFDADELLVKQALEALEDIGEVNVVRHDNNNGYNYFITFLSELGDIQQLTIDDSQLTGPDARARMATLIDGIPPSDYDSAIVPHSSTLMEYKIDNLDNGVAYFVRIRGKNAKGYGYAASAPSPMAPIRRPSSPTSVTMLPLSASRIRISWQAPEYNGGASITKYVVQWDTDSSFSSAWVDGFYHERWMECDMQDGGEMIYCHTLTINPASANIERYGRVLAYNGYKWSAAETGVILDHAAASTPGPVRNFNAFPSSSIGLILEWDHPAKDDEETCDYAGDGGSTITHYVVEYDSVADFSSPATSVIVSSLDIEFRIGGRDVLYGAESSALESGGTY